MTTAKLVRYRSFSKVERDELISNLTRLPRECDADIRKWTVDHLTACDQDYGKRIADGLAQK